MILKATSGQKVELVDVQGSIDRRNIAINRVGIKDLQHPAQIRGRDGEIQHTIGQFSLYVALPEQYKGTHMSRFVELLNESEVDLSVEGFGKLLPRVTDRLNADKAYVEASFPFFLKKKAPVSGITSRMDYRIHMQGSLEQGTAKTSIAVSVPVTSLCPCSKEISNYGAHNQRSIVTIRVETDPTMTPPAIEDLIEIVEKNGSCELWALLKRPDEKHVTEKAYENPKFVEDIVRDVAVVLEQEKSILSYQVEAENFESIHNHSAYALIEKEKSRN